MELSGTIVKVVNEWQYRGKRYAIYVVSSGDTTHLFRSRGAEVKPGMSVKAEGVFRNDGHGSYFDTESCELSVPKEGTARREGEVMEVTVHDVIHHDRETGFMVVDAVDDDGKSFRMTGRRWGVPVTAGDRVEVTGRFGRNGSYGRQFLVKSCRIVNEREMMPPPDVSASETATGAATSARTESHSLAAGTETSTANADRNGRIEAGILKILEEAGNAGSVCLPRDILLKKAGKLLPLPEETIVPVLDGMLEGDRPKVILSGNKIYHPDLFAAEVTVAADLLRLSSGKAPSRRVSMGAIERQMSRAAGRRISLNEQQKAAVSKAVSSPVSILTGGPGTGKTLTTRAILAALEARGEKVLLAAPTGRAAKRMSEVTDHQAQTVHRMLEFRDGAFERWKEHPLEADAVIVDESSMLDIELAANLLEAVRKGTRIVFVGDADQIPPVGPGTAFRDMIASGAVPVTRLSAVYRQGKGSLIIDNANAINEGRMPELDTTGERDFLFIESADRTAAAKAVLDLVEKYRESGEYAAEDVEIVTAMRREGNPLGSSDLNAAVRRSLAGGKEPEARFVTGDRVMQTRNDYKKGIFNGNFGKVDSADDADGTVTVSFEGIATPVTYNRAEAADLDYAYAITTHKSQGSEFPVVIIPVMKGLDDHMMDRNLLYTAVTRAKKKCIVVGDREAVANVIMRKNTERRSSQLLERLRGELDCPPVALRRRIHEGSRVAIRAARQESNDLGVLHGTSTNKQNLPKNNYFNDKDMAEIKFKIEDVGLEVEGLGFVPLANLTSPERAENYLETHKEAFRTALLKMADSPEPALLGEQQRKFFEMRTARWDAPAGATAFREDLGHIVARDAAMRKGASGEDLRRVVNRFQGVGNGIWGQLYLYGGDIPARDAEMKFYDKGYMEKLAARKRNFEAEMHAEAEGKLYPEDIQYLRDGYIMEHRNDVFDILRTEAVKVLPPRLVDFWEHSEIEDVAENIHESEIPGRIKANAVALQALAVLNGDDRISADERKRKVEDIMRTVDETVSNVWLQGIIYHYQMHHPEPGSLSQRAFEDSVRAYHENKEAINQMELEATVYKPSPVDTSDVILNADEMALIERAAIRGYENRRLSWIVKGDVIEQIEQNPKLNHWNKLTDAERESYRATMKEAVKVLKKEGIDPTAYFRDHADISREDRKRIIDVVARNAHDTWAKVPMDAGWTYGPITSLKEKHHPMLLPYDSLHDSQKEGYIKVGSIIADEVTAMIEANKRKVKVALFVGGVNEEKVSFDPNKVIQLTAKEAFLLKALRGDDSVILERDGHPAASQQYVVMCLANFKAALCDNLPELELCAVSRTLSERGIWDVVESLDGKLSLDADPSVGRETGDGIICKHFADGFHNSLREDLESRSLSAVEKVFKYEEYTGKPWYVRVADNIREFFGGVRPSDAPAAVTPNPAVLDLLRAEGHLAKDSLGLSADDQKMLLTTGYMKEFYPVLSRIAESPLGDVREGEAVRKPARKPDSYSWSEFVQQSVRDITDFEQQMEATGRYEGYFVRKDADGNESYLICEVGEKGPGKSITFIECKEAFENMKTEYASGILQEDGKTYAVDGKAMGELASGRTVELKCKETGEYASFAYSIRDNKIKPSASFEQCMKDILKVNESNAVKQNPKESKEKTAKESASHSRGPK